MDNTSTITAVAEPVAPVRLKAMIIDDAFDEGVRDSGILLEDYLSYVEESGHKEKIETLLADNQIEIPDLHGVASDSTEFMQLMDSLWKLRNEKPETREYLNPLFHVKLDKIGDLETICDNLKKHNFEVVTKNSTTNSFDEVKGDHYKIILLDYNLGPDGPQAIRNANDKARTIYNLCDPDKKPLMVLMSSYASAKGEVENFRRNSNLGNVIFRFAPKENLKDNSTVSLLVELYKSESEQVHKLQKYITSLHQAAKKAADTFETDVSKLTIDDYTFIHQTTVDDQSHPFGDYLGWLYGSHWSNLLLSNPDLKTQKDELDSLMAGKPLPYYGMPSDAVVGIYMNALFEPEIGDIPAIHRLAGKTLGKDKKIAEFPHLHLGDIFIEKGGAELYMVINPQCDLERRLDNMGKQSILLIPGDLFSLKDGRSSTPHNTELIIVENERYQIIWKIMQVISVPLENFNEWKNGRKLKRNWRLRLPFALEIQQEFTSKMSRVGLPVSPPFSREVKIQVFIKRIGSDIELLLPDGHREGTETAPALVVSEEYGFSADWPAQKPDRRIRLTLDFAIDLKKSLSKKKQEILENEQPELGDQGNPKLSENDRKTIEKIDACFEKFDDWFLKTPYFEYPSIDGNPILIPNFIRGILNYEYETKKDWGTLLLINVVKPSASASGVAEPEEVLSPEMKAKKEVKKPEVKPKRNVAKKAEAKPAAKSKVKRKAEKEPKEKPKPKKASKKSSGKKKK